MRPKYWQFELWDEEQEEPMEHICQNRSADHQSWAFNSYQDITMLLSWAYTNLWNQRFPRFDYKILVDHQSSFYLSWLIFLNYLDLWQILLKLLFLSCRYTLFTSYLNPGLSYHCQVFDWSEWPVQLRSQYIFRCRCWIRLSFLNYVWCRLHRMLFCGFGKTQGYLTLGFQNILNTRLLNNF